MKVAAAAAVASSVFTFRSSPTLKKGLDLQIIQFHWILSLDFTPKHILYKYIMNWPVIHLE